MCNSANWDIKQFVRFQLKWYEWLNVIIKSSKPLQKAIVIFMAPPEMREDAESNEWRFFSFLFLLISIILCKNTSGVCFRTEEKAVG